MPTASAASTPSSSVNIQENNIPNAKPEVSEQNNIETNKRWLDYYKAAAMIKGDLSNLGKVEYICKYKESEILWKTWENKLPCSLKECFVQYIVSPYWESLNTQINNVYTYIKSATQE